KIRLGNRTNLSFRIIGTLLCLLITVFRGAAARLALYKAGLDVTVLELGTALLLIALQQTFETTQLHANSVSASAGRFGSIRILGAARFALFHATSFLRWFGRNSYEAYLTHMFVIWPMVVLFQNLHLSINWSPLWFFATTA